MIQIGVSDPNGASLPQPIGMVEVDAFGSPPSGDRPTFSVLSAGFYFFHPDEDPTSRDERGRILLEIADRDGHSGLLLKLPPSIATRPEILDAVSRLISRWPIRDKTVFVDPGRIDLTPEIERQLTATGALLVLDPFYHPDATRSIYWRIHGWHETRWIRRYGKAQLTHLARRCLHKGAHSATRNVVFAHSQRISEALDFHRILHSIELGTRQNKEMNR